MAIKKELKKLKPKIAGYFGRTKGWSKEAAKLHASQLRRKKFKGVEIKNTRHGVTVLYRKKGKGSKYFKL